VPAKCKTHMGEEGCVHASIRSAFPATEAS
jgi:hypothetical protein